MKNSTVLEIGQKVKLCEDYIGYFDNMKDRVFTVKAFHTAKEWFSNNETRYDKSMPNVVELEEIKEIHGIGVDSIEVVKV